VWDPRVLADIEAGRNPVGVTAYFAALYDANYRDAATHDAPGKVIFFEGARITLEAHMAEYPAEYHEELRKVLTKGDGWNPDKVIVLTSSTDTIDKHIRLRNRPFEPVENMVRRFRLIDGEFRRLAEVYPNTVLINRDGIEFHDRAGLMAIITQAGLRAADGSPRRPLRPATPGHMEARCPWGRHLGGLHGRRHGPGATGF
jgi:hypothetical protein